MSKPDWKDAPEWAKWLAMDEDREWWWYAAEPMAGGGVWINPSGGMISRAVMPDDTWAGSLEPRPQP